MDVIMEYFASLTLQLKAVGTKFSVFDKKFWPQLQNIREKIDEKAGVKYQVVTIVICSAISLNYKRKLSKMAKVFNA